ncbi:Uncharacterised protein [Yersinia similis]|nr:Uncharacterised protein [Yersinia similis]
MNIVTANRLIPQLRCLPAAGPEPFRYLMRVHANWIPVTSNVLAQIVDTFRYPALPAPRAG